MGYSWGIKEMPIANSKTLLRTDRCGRLRVFFIAMAYRAQQVFKAWSPATAFLKGGGPMSQDLSCAHFAPPTPPLHRPNAMSQLS